jgi:hypothetical protein
MGADRAFAAYFIARQAGWLAAAVEDVAIGWQIYAIHHRAIDLAFIGLIAFAPQLLLAIPAGSIADRFDRRGVALALTCVNVLGSLAFIWLSVNNAESLAAWYGALAIVACANAASVPSQRALLPQLRDGERLVKASALISSFSQLVVIAGPALAGLLIAWHVPAAFVAVTACYALAALAYLVLPPQGRPAHDPAAESVLSYAVGGFRYLFQNRIILGAISLDLFAVLFGGATALLPIVATQLLHVGAAGFGLLRAAPAVGAALVALWLSRRPIRRAAGRLLFFVVAGFGIFTIVFGLSRSFWLSLASLALLGGFDMVSVVIRIVLVQVTTPNELRGRVSAIENIFIGASNELGAFESGALAALTNAPFSILFGGCMTLLVIGLWSLFFPELRTLDRLHVSE